MTSVQIGDLIARKYRVERILGRGGMGVVVAARHELLHELVGLKFLHSDVLSSPDAVERFLREARAAVRLKSEHVCRVMDVGTLDTGAPFIVMEYLEGEDLKAVLTRRGPLAPSEAAHLLIEACDAMAEAHAAGVIHRDLKPHNLFLARRGGRPPILKVLDFGISKAECAGGILSSTTTSAIMGSPAYMSPEQRGGGWALEEVLRSPTPDAHSWFGRSVALDGDRLAVGQPNSSGNEVHVFERTGSDWAYAQTLESFNGFTLAFGWSVALDGELLAVGAPLDPTGADDAGAVFTFRFDGISFAAESFLQASDFGAGAKFGYSVAARDGVLAVGAPSAAGTGAAYLFLTDDGWYEAAILTAASLSASDDFGWSVATDGAAVLVGAWREDGSATSINGVVDELCLNAGAAFLYE